MLPRIIGLGRAAELLYTGRPLHGWQAYAWGFFNELCAADALHQRAREVAGEIAAGPTLAHAMTKKMLHEEWALPLDEAIDADAQAQARLMESGDFHRAYEAFVAKRRPQFEGN